MSNLRQQAENGPGLRPGISVCIPTIQPRRQPGTTHSGLSMLGRAVASVNRQTLQPDEIHTVHDRDRRGAPHTRDQALAQVDTELVAFLDDDDELLPTHLEKLAVCLAETDADLVYPWYQVIGGTDPFPRHKFQPWDDQHPHQVPVTFLARTETIRAAGGFSYAWDPTQGEDPGVDPDGNRAGEDWRLILRLVANGARIVHLPEITWLWHHHGRNTSGLPSRW